MSVDSIDKSQVVTNNWKLAFPILADIKLEAAGAYGVEDADNGIAWPAIFIIDRRGIVRWRSLSPTYTERAPAATVLRALDEVMAAPNRP